MRVENLRIADLAVSNLNTRKDLEGGQEDSSLDDLARSIREKGLLTPVTVRPRSDGTYELIAGQRRFLACKLLGMTEIPAVIREDLDDTGATAVSLIENVHRADMAPMDKARAFGALHDHYDGDMTRVSKECGFSPQTVKKYLALNNLPPELQARISTSDGPARIDALNALVRTFDNPGDMVEAYDRIAGFRQEVQIEILRRSGGDLDAIDEMREAAIEGAFDLKLLRHDSVEDCPFIPEGLRPAVAEIVQQYELDLGAGKLERDALRDAIARLRETRL